MQTIELKLCTETTLFLELDNYIAFKLTRKVTRNEDC